MSPSSDFQEFPGSASEFLDFPDLENDFLKFQHFPGFPGPVQTLDQFQSNASATQRLQQFTSVIIWLCPEFGSLKYDYLTEMF